MSEYNPEKLWDREGATYTWNPEHGRYYSGESILSPEAEALARQSHHVTTLLVIQHERLAPLMAKKSEANNYKKEHGSFPENYDEQAVNESIENIRKEISAINQAFYPSDDIIFDVLDVTGKLILLSGLASVAILGTAAVLTWKIAKIPYAAANYGWEKITGHTSPTKAGFTVAGGTASIFAVGMAANDWNKFANFVGKAADTVFQMGVAAGTSMALFMSTFKASEAVTKKITGKDNDTINAVAAGAVTAGANIAAYKHMGEKHIRTATGLLSDVWYHGAHFVHTVVKPVVEVAAVGAILYAAFETASRGSEYAQEKISGKSSTLVNRLSGGAAALATAFGLAHFMLPDAPSAPDRAPAAYSAPATPERAPVAP